MHKVLFAIFAATILFLPQYSNADCSTTYKGQASLNEFFKDNANQTVSANDFAEVKILNTALNSSIYANWKIEICEKNTGKNNSGDGCSGLIPLNQFYDVTSASPTVPDLTGPWLVNRNGSIGKYINTKTGFDAVLVDQSGNLIDYIRVDGYTAAFDRLPSTCDLTTLPFSYDAGAPGTSDKSLHRNPDGTGPWGKTSSAADPGTTDTTNDVPPVGTDPLPIISVSNVSVSKGTDAVFTITLDKAVAYPVSVQYSAQGGDAVEKANAVLGKFDYTTKAGTISFAVGEPSKQVTITTEGINYKNSGSVFFYFYLYNQINASLLNNYPTGTIAALSALHHIEFVHDQAALTCSPEQITVKACANADCSTLVTSATTVGLSPTGWVGGNSKIFTGSAIYDLKHTVAESVLLSTSSVSPTPSSSLVCKTAAGVIINPCTITFSDSGFIFRNDTDSLSATTSNITIPTQLSGKASNVGYNSKTLSLRAVKKSATDPTQCVPAFKNKTLNIEFAAECINPSTCVSGQLFNLTSENVSGNLTATTNNNSVAGSSSYDTRSINFDVDGKANIIFTYPEAGLMELHARHNILLSDGTTASGTYMSGSSTFVVRPLGFSLDVSGQRAADYLNNGLLDNSTGTDFSYATDATGSFFQKAGDDFVLTLSAVQWQAADDANNDGVADTTANLTNNTTTKNFGNETTPVTPANITLVPTTTLPNTGTITNSVNSASFTNGIGTKTISYSEVGIADITSTLSDYLTAGTTITNKTPSFGRFSPHHFDTLVTHGCNNIFTYSGQPFTVAVTARNKANAITRNYRDTFAYGVTLSDVSPASPALGTFANNTFSSANFSINPNYGVGSQSTVTYTFTTKDTIPETIEIRATDTTDTAITSNGFSEDTTNIRSGRMRLENVYGPEITPLTMPVKVEFYSNNSTATTTDDGYITSTDDSSCSTYDAPNGTLGSFTGNLSNTPTAEVAVTGTSSVNSGVGSITFHKPGDITLGPGVGNDGSVNLLLNNISSWLTYNWGIDCDGDGANDTGACGTASFGLYRGDDRIIYWREVF